MSRKLGHVHREWPDAPMRIQWPGASSTPMQRHGVGAVAADPLQVDDFEGNKVVARDGIEPPTPAFSGPPSNLLSGLESV
jgi:hypothetical protein